MSPDDTKINPSQTSTVEANKWKESVKNREILGDNGKYKFDSNGNLTITHTYNGESWSENYTFWGAINDTTAIYYERINIRDIFGDTAPNTETWYYYGVRLDTINNKFNVYTISNYDSLLNDWWQNNFDKNGSPKPNIDWSKMPVQSKDNIDWNNSFINGDLIKKQ